MFLEIIATPHFHWHTEESTWGKKGKQATLTFSATAAAGFYCKKILDFEGFFLDNARCGEILRFLRVFN